MPVAALLFSKGMLPHALDGRRRALVQEVETVPEDHVVQVDEAAWVAGLVDRYRVEPPFLRPDEITMEDPKPVQVDVSWDRSRLIRVSPTYVPGHQTVVHIPFSGEEHVFHHVPSTHILRDLHARVASRELLLDIEYPDDRPVNFQAHTARFIESVEANLENARQDIQRFNAGLEHAATLAIQGRRKRIEQSRAHVAQTGFPLTSHRDSAKTYIPDVITRRPAPPLPSTKPGHPMELEPVLLAETYNSIVHDIRQMGRSMERNPGAYANMGEEDRRHHILDALNINYSGAGTAEAFNFRGRTDIRILHEGRSLFIAECKIWHGRSKFSETLDQLLGYQAWRDTKLAVIMFVSEENLTTMMERARTALETHPQFISWHHTQDETELRAEVSHRGDARRRADLTVLFIHTPPS